MPHPIPFAALLIVVVFAFGLIFSVFDDVGNNPQTYRADFLTCVAKSSYNYSDPGSIHAKCKDFAEETSKCTKDSTNKQICI
jgi:hypothetical protein